jgi:sugar transferase (PEP-CTERM/EpsH1 system associated)
MGQYVPGWFDGRTVLDLVDVDSAKFAQYAREGAVVRRPVFAREARLLRAEEVRLADRADAVTLVSEKEASLFRSMVTPGIAAKVRALGNGIDHAFFDPASVIDAPRVYEGEGPQLCFTGQMDYPPNVDAARRAAHAILPRIRETYPHAQMHIVGRAPVAAVRSLAALPGVHVHGAVPDMRPFLSQADIALVPLSLARGVQNKVLEAMAMARPCVLTPGAATGIDGDDGKHFCIGESDAALADQCVTLLNDQARAQVIGKAARQFVIDRQSWPAMLAPLPALMGVAQTQARDAA